MKVVESDSSPVEQKIVWSSVIYFAILHVGALWGLWIMFTFQIKWQTWVILLLGCWATGLGVTVGVHRYWCHRTYKASKGLQIFLLFLQSMSGQGNIYDWCRDHRVHHKFTDTDADPYNSRRGFFFCHMGWTVQKKHPEVKGKGEIVDMSDLKSDPLVQFQKKYYTYFYLLCAFLFPTILPLLVGETFHNSLFTMFFFRYCSSLHATWSVNSFAHMYGMKPYTKNIEPTENAIVSLFTSGEGWHNYHHTFPWDYRASEFGASLNSSCSVIDFFHRMGWATDLKSATPEMVNRRALKQGDGTHASSVLARENDSEVNNISEMSQ